MIDKMSPPSQFTKATGNHRIAIHQETDDTKFLLHDFYADAPRRPRILVLKLDHRGDFLIGLPALERLRAVFPDGHLTLVCGSWNVATARDLAVADDIRAYDFAPENAQGWNGEPVESLERFREVCEGRFDIAVDLRAEEDTRPLLQHVDAALRCGIGSRSRHPFLNIILPGESRLREVPPIEADALVFDPGAFVSRMPVQTVFFHETDFSVSDMHMVYGPYRRLPLGKLRAEFGFELSAPPYCRSRPVEIAVEAVRDGAADVIAFQRIRTLENAKLTTVALEFTNDDRMARYEFRVFVGGRPRWSRLRFFGVCVHAVQKHRAPRLSPAELHVGEELTLLVQLIAERLRPIYSPELVDRIADAQATEASDAAAGRCIVIAPFSNSQVRDWPIDRYTALVGLLLKQFDGMILLVGTRGQAGLLEDICRTHGDDRRLVNLGGRTDWAGLAAVLRKADLVIANNSGVAHLAGACGRPTLAIYSGSHEPQQWGPRGEAVRTISAVVPCSPCGYERLELCPHDHRCMTLIEPGAILAHALAMLGARDVGVKGDAEVIAAHARPIASSPP